ncbi:MAG: AMP-binding protein [Flavobacteriaceae bacterium]
MDNYVWHATKAVIENSNIYKMMLLHHFDNYIDFWKWSVTNRNEFWDETVQNLEIKFAKRYSAVLDVSDGIETPIWLKDAQLNIVDSCFKNNPDATAVVYQKEGGKLTKVSQQKLENLVNKIANSLRQAGLKQGDAIAIDMPMTLEAIAIYLAGIKAGNPIVTIADSFTPNEIAVRLKIANPKLIFTQDYLLRAAKILPLFDKVCQAKAPKAVVIKATDKNIELRSGDIFWEDFLKGNTSFESVKQSPDEVITILFSSGTTGNPKAIPWTHTTPIKGAADAYYHHDIHKNDVVCWPTNLGWMMGPWLVFTALINKATIGLFYGAPLDSGFGTFVQNTKVTMLGVVPSIVKHWKASGCMENLDWNTIRCFSSTGEVSNPTEMTYLMQLAGGKPVIEYCGGTEIGGGYVTSTVIQDNYPSTFSTQALGTEFVLLDDDNKASNKGEVFMIPPTMGLSNTLLNRDHHKEYYEGTPRYKNHLLRRHGDAMLRLDNGYYKAQGRTDDAMNLGGIKVGSIQIESVISTLDFVKESAAIAVAPKDGGPSLLVVYYVALQSNLSDDKRHKQAQIVVRKQLNPLFKVSDLVKIEALPRTASNKVMRRKLRADYESK